MDHKLPDRPTVEDLDAALRTYRRLLLTALAIVVLGFPSVIGLSFLGTWLAPPYGLRIMGWSLTEWGLVLLLAGLFGYLWVTGRKLGCLLDDRTLLAFPIVGILSGLQVIAQHAHARGMAWSGFLGPLRPARQ
ncbi:ABC transporter ATP-binding protein [Methylobacterium sp. A54F]